MGKLYEGQTDRDSYNYLKEPTKNFTNTYPNFAILIQNFYINKH